MRLFFLIFITLGFLIPKSHATHCEGYLTPQAVQDKKPSALALAQKGFVFPEEAHFFTFEHLLRYSIHEAFEGIDFYTGEPLSFENMSIDHIIPRASGGEDNVFNYVPTNAITNSLKGHKFTLEDLETLKAVRDIYGPRVMALLKAYGAFDNRELELLHAIQANSLRRRYSSSKRRRIIPELLNSTINTDRVIVYRRSMDQPSDGVYYLLKHLSTLLTQLDEKQIQGLVESKVFSFKLPMLKSLIVKPEEALVYRANLSYRAQGAKVVEDALSVTVNMFEITSYRIDPKQNMIHVEMEFHPMFLLKLLEVPKNFDLAEDFIYQIFKPVDIKVEEFMDWTSDQ